jgi:hypothetical protein
MIRPSATPFPVQHQGEKMEAYRIDRFGSVDGIVLRSSEGPRPGCPAEGDPDAGARELA